jgi:hypothetical protein
MKKERTLNDMFAAFGGPSSTARRINEAPSSVTEMKRRRVVPVWLWGPLVEAAKVLGIKWVTIEFLFEAHESIYAKMRQDKEQRKKRKQ